MRFAVRLFCRLALLCVLSWMLSASSLVSAQPRVLPQRALPPHYSGDRRRQTGDRSADSRQRIGPQPRLHIQAQSIEALADTDGLGREMVSPALIHRLGSDAAAFRSPCNVPPGVVVGRALCGAERSHRATAGRGLNTKNVAALSPPRDTVPRS